MAQQKQPIGARPDPVRGTDEKSRTRSVQIAIVVGLLAAIAVAVFGSF